VSRNSHENATVINNVVLDNNLPRRCLSPQWPASSRQLLETGARFSSG